jgi:peptide deformylase
LPYLPGMALRPILVAPDPRLKQVSEPVAEVTDEIRRLMDDMLETMYEAPGIGLAAIQVGVAKRVIVMDLGKPDDDDEGAPKSDKDKKDKKVEREPRFFVNP